LVLDHWDFNDNQCEFQYDAVDDLHKFIHTNVDNSKCNHREFQHNGVLNQWDPNNSEHNLREFQHDRVYDFCKFNHSEFKF